MTTIDFDLYYEELENSSLDKMLRSYKRAKREKAKQQAQLEALALMALPGLPVQLVSRRLLQQHLAL